MLGDGERVRLHWFRACAEHDTSWYLALPQAHPLRLALLPLSTHGVDTRSGGVATMISIAAENRRKGESEEPTTAYPSCESTPPEALKAVIIQL